MQDIVGGVATFLIILLILMLITGVYEIGRWIKRRWL